MKTPTEVGVVTPFDPLRVIWHCYCAGSNGCSLTKFHNPCKPANARPDSLGTAATILYAPPLRRLGKPLIGAMARTNRDSLERALKSDKSDRMPDPSTRLQWPRIVHSFFNLLTGEEGTMPKTLTLTNNLGALK